MKNIYWILAVLTTLLSCASCDRSHDDAVEALQSEMYKEVKSTDKMVFASMAVTKTVKTDRTDWYKVGKRIAVYSYDSYLRAYIDLSQLQPEDIVFDDKTKTVSLMLPPVQTEVTGRDMGMKKVYENIGMFRTNVDSRERAEMKEKANASFMREVEKNPEFKKRLKEEAERKARSYFTAIFDSYGYASDISFRS